MLNWKARAIDRGYRIIAAQPEHLPALPSIELAAAGLLAAHAPRSVLEEATPGGVFRKAQCEHRLWVAVADDAPIGFALVTMLGDGHSHLEEIDVAPEHGRRGVGAGLVAAVLKWAHHSGHVQTTLTTFRAPPWNMPFYRRVGFEEVRAAEWSSQLRHIVAAEHARGLLQERRCVMRCRHHPEASRC